MPMVQTPADVATADAPSLGAVQAVRRHSAARGSARAVLLVIAAHANPDGTNARPSVPTLARETGLDRATVHRALRKLEAAGEIRTKSGGGRKANRYTITLAGLPTVVDKPVDNFDHDQAGAVADCDRTRRKSRPHPSQIATRPSLDRPLTERPPARCAQHAAVAAPPPCGACRDARVALEEWQAGRRDRDRAADVVALREQIEAERARTASPDQTAAGLVAARSALRHATNGRAGPADPVL